MLFRRNLNLDIGILCIDLHFCLDDDVVPIDVTR
ncbi:hypothetical protein M6B38_343880 [Iris pallida]|uniref:Uncharacterized protein n=1 Tax=Iris pallida TaxID=29817 RepID=A0AAX6GTZ7_IRIPA|nr:hypothetical protein M6B38_343880 [Iris pallida]